MLERAILRPLRSGHATRVQLSALIALGLALFLFLLPFHLVVKKNLPDPLGTYWKEMLLGGLVLLWAMHCWRMRRLVLTDTPLDRAVLIYLGLLLVRFLLDRSGWVGAWGLYVSILYLPLFWLVPTALRHYPRWTSGLMLSLVTIGGLVALGGLIEFVLDVPLWPSEEMVRRQGFPDVFIYGTLVRRVYFTFDSPTTLANTLAMLVPLALALALPSSQASASRQTWKSLAAGLAAVLMIACIVVTFSRGIWVATVVALLSMGLLSSLVRRSRPVVLSVAGALTLIGLVWGWTTLVRAGQSAPGYQGVVELSPQAYRTAPVTRVVEELLQAEPDYGRAITQTWTLLDPVTGQYDTRTVLYEHPLESGKGEIIYRIAVPEYGALRFGIALAPEVWSPEKGDGASFQLHVAECTASGSGQLSSASPGQFVLVRYINPKSNPSDRRWRNFLVDLSPWAGRTVHLSLITENGPDGSSELTADRSSELTEDGDWAFDWAGWAELELVTVAPDYFSSAQTENAVLRHTGSIMDWARDETNRDRLAAWSLALTAWRKAPLWGNGLGSTGVAALRTQPEQAFVTESQVLKALVELGLPGLFALAYLWLQVASVGWRAYRHSSDAMRRTLLLGILTSLMIVFVEGWVYQNLEVKQVNAYFWTLVGALAFLARDGNG